jgi:hypothetical protein
MPRTIAEGHKKMRPRTSGIATHGDPLPSPRERRQRAARTALVHEAYLRLIDAKLAHWEDRAHFFAVCAQMMRRILVH